ncbi:MAG: hypothetical protein OHM77_04435 [Candidatus Nitricoxidivorans perseverans]|uniref:Uncharacterized protein n=1 Tax=Candidatus Nitricoxidivorans perseverans TaxID=2975601 RepID=A0AA49FNC9_9PROT|nr:MAG: hypothetical protein OHM77_04435 [Candidatus Nitricoxidivorans perseverans]
MAIRVRNRFHAKGRRSPATLASVVAVLAWKLAIESIKRMRRADYDIDIGRPYFDFVCEFLVFMALAADRIAHRELDPGRRAEFTAALAKRLSEIVEENNGMLLSSVEPGACRRGFVDLFNRRSGEYAEFDYGADGPDFGFRRYFAACLREILPEKDRLWVIDQTMDIESPEAIKTLSSTLAGLFHPESALRHEQHVTVVG